MSYAALFCNELAQGLRPMRDGIDWFESMEEQQMRAVLRSLAACITQTRARPEDVTASINKSGIKPTATSAVLLSKPELAVQLAKVADLPVPELRRAFPLFVTLLAVADERRRRTTCGGRCTHWWHHLQ